MKRPVVRVLGHRRTFYVSCILGSFSLISSQFASFYTDPGSEWVVALVIVSIFLYTFSLVTYVWRDRRTTTRVLRETCALRAEIDGLKKAEMGDLTAEHRAMIQRIERVETNLNSALNEYHNSYLAELKTQAFNSHLAVQDLKSFIAGEVEHCD